MRVFLIAFVFIVSCSNHDKKASQLEQLGNMFGAANWQIVKGSDTSYVFFSPQLDNSFKTYEYNLFKGDSVNTEIGYIKRMDERIEWLFFNKVLVLNNMKKNELTWQDGTKTNHVLIQQNDSLLIMKTSAGELQFKKTLPLSTFLVRTQFDYRHGSNMADSSEVKPKKMIRY